MQSLDKLIDLLKFNFSYDKSNILENVEELLKTPGGLLDALQGQSTEQFLKYFPDLSSETTLLYLKCFEFAYAFMHFAHLGAEELTSNSEKNIFYNTWVECLIKQTIPSNIPTGLKSSWETYNLVTAGTRAEIQRFIQGQVDIERNSLQEGVFKKPRTYLEAEIQNLRDENKQMSINEVLSLEEVAEFKWRGTILTTINAEKNNLQTIFSALFIGSENETLIQMAFDDFLNYLEKEITSNSVSEYSDTEWKEFCHKTMKQYIKKKIAEAKSKSEGNNFANQNIDWSRIEGAFPDDPNLEILKLILLKEINSDMDLQKKALGLLKEPIVVKAMCSDKMLTPENCVALVNYKPKANHALAGVLDLNRVFKRFLENTEINQYFPMFFKQFFDLFIRGENEKSIKAMLSICLKVKNHIEEQSFEREVKNRLIKNLIENFQDGLFYLISLELKKSDFNRLLNIIVEYSIQSIDDLFALMSRNPNEADTAFINNMLHKLVFYSSSPENNEEKNYDALSYIFRAAMKHQNDAFITPYEEQFKRFLQESNSEGKCGLRLIVEDNISLAFLRSCKVDLSVASEISGLNLVHFCILSRKPDKLRDVIALGIFDLTFKSKKGISPLFYALEMQDTASLAILLSDDSVRRKINAKSLFHNEIPVIFAALHEDAAAVALLLQNGANPEASIKIKRYLAIGPILFAVPVTLPLIHIVIMQNFAMFSAFIENAPGMITLAHNTYQDKRPIEMAMHFNKLDVVRALLKYERLNLDDTTEDEKILLESVLKSEDLILMKNFLAHPRYKKIFIDLMGALPAQTLTQLNISGMTYHFIKAHVLLYEMEALASSYAIEDGSKRTLKLVTNMFISREETIRLINETIHRLKQWIGSSSGQVSYYGNNNSSSIEALNKILQEMSAKQPSFFAKKNDDLNVILQLFDIGAGPENSFAVGSSNNLNRTAMHPFNDELSKQNIQYYISRAILIITACNVAAHNCLHNLQNPSGAAKLAYTFIPDKMMTRESKHAKGKKRAEEIQEIFAEIEAIQKKQSSELQKYEKEKVILQQLGKLIDILNTGATEGGYTSNASLNFNLVQLLTDYNTLFNSNFNKATEAESSNSRNPILNENAQKDLAKLISNAEEIFKLLKEELLNQGMDVSNTIIAKIA